MLSIKNNNNYIKDNDQIIDFYDYLEQIKKEANFRWK